MSSGDGSWVLGRVAGELFFVGERRGAVGGWLRRGAWAATQLPALQRRQRLRRARWFQRVFFAQREVGEDWADARVVTVRVVVGGGLTEVAQRALEVRRVGTEEGRDRDRFSVRAHRLRSSRR